jgi:hypothetical protein
MDLSAADFTAAEIQLPMQSVKGKAIDDILIRDTALFLVDNIMYPKYIFTYDISRPAVPLHVITEKLPSKRTYEHIRKGDINAAWMVLFSASVGEGGAFQHITVRGNSGKNEVLSFLIEQGMMGKQDTEERILDIALVNDYLLLLFAGDLKYLDLTKEVSKDNLTILRKTLPDADKLIKTPDGHVVLASAKGYELLNLGGLK